MRTMVCFGIVKAVQVPATVGLILCVVGATSSTTPQDTYGQTTIRVGIILFTVVFATLLALSAMAAMVFRKTKRGERPLILAIGIASPFLLVRMIYPLIAAFGHDQLFTIGNDSTSAVTVSLCMEVLEECIVVLIYLLVGMRLVAIPKHEETGEGGEATNRKGRLLGSLASRIGGT